MRTSHSLLLAGLTAILCLAPLPAAAQTLSSGTTESDPVLGESAAQPEPYLDRKVGSSLERFNRWKALMKKEHFTAYLTTYSALVAGLVGLLFGFSAYRLSDPMSPYRHIKKRSLQLAVAIGAGCGVFAAVMQVPPNTIGKVSLLFLAIGTGAATAMLATWFMFLILRFRSNRLARRDGRPVTKRMRHA